MAKNRELSQSSNDKSFFAAFRFAFIAAFSSLLSVFFPSEASVLSETSLFSFLAGLLTALVGSSFVVVALVASTFALFTRSLNDSLPPSILSSSSYDRPTTLRLLLDLSELEKRSVAPRLAAGADASVETGGAPM